MPDLESVPVDIYEVLFRFFNLYEIVTVIKRLNVTFKNSVDTLEERKCRYNYFHNHRFQLYRCPCQILTSLSDFGFKISFTHKNIRMRAYMLQQANRELGYQGLLPKTDIGRKFVQQRHPSGLEMCINPYLVAILCQNQSLKEMHVLEIAYQCFGILGQQVCWQTVKNKISLAVL